MPKRATPEAREAGAGSGQVWVTRTEPGASRLAVALRADGHRVLAAPVLTIAPSDEPPPPGGFDFALFVSEHAVCCAAAAGWRQAAWAHCPTAAIGGAGEAALRRHGVEPCLQSLADARAVTRALPTAPMRCLIVKGEGGRQLLQDWLRRNGGIVVEWNVYRRSRAAPNIAGKRVGTIVVSSAEGLTAAAKVWFAAGGDPAVRLLVPSSRVARRAAGLGFRTIVVTLGANAGAVVAALGAGAGDHSSPDQPPASSSV